jgi:hypothetical protein
MVEDIQQAFLGAGGGREQAPCQALDVVLQDDVGRNGGREGDKTWV